MASEELALDEIRWGETSKKCLLPINPISAPETSQGLIISGELRYISLQIIFSVHWAQQAFYSIGMMGFSVTFTLILFSLSSLLTHPVRDRKKPPITVISLWDSIHASLEGKRNSTRAGKHCVLRLSLDWLTNSSLEVWCMYIDGFHSG